MILLKEHESKLIITAEDTIIICDFLVGKHKLIKLPEVILPPNLTKGQEDVLRAEKKSITSVCFSKTNDLFAVTTQNKQVVVYGEDFGVLKNFTLNRAASKIHFSPGNDVLVADKTGDTFLYRLNGDVKSELVLGHLSMLLDILVSNCGKFIVTCDRDEKIRVSSYPNAYNIISYCLGHREFVTNIEIIGKMLISASGDGTLRLWDYLSGKQLDCMSTNEFVEDKVLLEDFTKVMDGENVEITALPITDMQVYRSIVAVSVVNYNNLIIFILSNKTIKFLQHIKVESQIIAFSLNGNLVVLTKDGFLYYQLENNCFCLIESEILQQIYNEHKTSLRNSFPCNVSVLYKRKYDNVQEYLERKKLRLECK